MCGAWWPVAHMKKVKLLTIYTYILKRKDTPTFVFDGRPTMSHSSFRSEMPSAMLWVLFNTAAGHAISTRSLILPRFSLLYDEFSDL
jgi:hypothetical protein